MTQAKESMVWTESLSTAERYLVQTTLTDPPACVATNEGEAPIYGCSGCATHSGRAGCPYHGLQARVWANPVGSMDVVTLRMILEELRTIRRLLEAPR